MPCKRPLGLLVAALTIVPAASALAAPVTIDLRVEGRTRTLYEGRVTTDVRPFNFTGDPQSYTCDGTGADGGTGLVPAPTAGAALAAAAETTPFAITGKWNPGFGPSFFTVAGDDTTYDAIAQTYLVENYNGRPAELGACAQPVQTGDSWVFAYGTFGEPLLALAGPATAAPGASVTVKATDAASGAPVAGAVVGGQTTGADGTAVVLTPTQRGVVSFKAAKPGAIRSNRFDVCLTDGADGFCGTQVAAPAAAAAAAAPAAVPASATAGATVTRAPGLFAKLASVVEGKRFARGAGPRSLAGRVDANVAGIKDIRLRLSRTDGRRCARYDGARERFVVTRACGIKRARTFSVGAQADFSYLLPSALPRGRYVLDVLVVDGAGHRTTTYQRGRNRVVFHVA